jgi:Helix-turn-helix domain
MKKSQLRKSAFEVCQPATSPPETADAIVALRNLDSPLIAAIADAVAARLRPTLAPPGWPEGRGSLSEPETAKFLSVGQDFLRELRQTGRISHTAIGRRIVYSAENVAEFLRRCKRPQLEGSRGCVE